MKSHRSARAALSAVVIAGSWAIVTAGQPPQTPSRLPLRLAWTASVLVLVLAVWAAFAWRADIAAAWPPSGRVYGLFGFQANAK